MKDLEVVNNNTQIADVIDYNAKALEYLESMGNKLPTKQKTQFLEMAQAFKLNPFKREIYAVGYGDNWNIITGYEVYLKRAERIGLLDGWKATVDGSGETMTSTVTIYRKDWKMPFEHTVLFSEVCQKTKEGKLNNVWSKMPSFMCKKVAIAQAFRLCFPDEFAGMPYIADEMPEIDVTPSESQPVTTSKTSKPNFTKAQAEELAKLMKSEFSDGRAMFTEEEKEPFRKMLKSGLVEDAITQAKDAIESKNKLFQQQKAVEDAFDVEVEIH